MTIGLDALYSLAADPPIGSLSTVLSAAELWTRYANLLARAAGHQVSPGAEARYED